MGYVLGGIDLDSFGVIPSISENSNLALSGCWDMPARLGKCYHDWGNDEDGFEPYVRADEIRLGGRDIVYTALVEAKYQNEVLRKLYGLYEQLKGFTTLVDFVTDLGTFSVYLKDDIQAEYLHQGWAKIKIAMRQPIVPILGDVPASDNSLYGIDNISFASMGMCVMDVQNTFSFPARKSMVFTSYTTEGYQLTKRTAQEITLKILLEQNTYSGFKDALNGLYKLFSKEGLRTLTYERDALRTFFVKDGFQVTNVIQYSNGNTWGIITVRCVQVGSELDWNFLVSSSGVNITSSSGELITISN